MTKLRKGHCPVCGPDKNAHVMGEHRHAWRDEEIFGSDDYYILKCGGCDYVYFQVYEVFSEDFTQYRLPSGQWEVDENPRVTHWPPPESRKKPHWLSSLIVPHTNIYDAMNDFYGCLDAGLHRPAAVAARTAFELVGKQLGLNTSNFDVLLKDLEDNKHVSQSEADTLRALKEAGNGVVHRLWTPTPDDVSTIADVLEGFVSRVFIIRERSEEMLSRIPARSGKRKKD